MIRQPREPMTKLMIELMTDPKTNLITNPMIDSKTLGVGHEFYLFFYYRMMYFTTPLQDLLWVVWKATIFGHSLVLFY